MHELQICTPIKVTYRQQQEKNATVSAIKIITKVLVIKRIRKTGRVR